MLFLERADFEVRHWFSEGLRQNQGSCQQRIDLPHRDIHQVLEYSVVSDSPAEKVDKIEVAQEYGTKAHKMVRCEVKLAKVQKLTKEKTAQRRRETLW